MAADLEILMGVIRAGPAYAGRAAALAGGPTYSFAATVIIRGNSAEIVGGVGTVTPSMMRDIEATLRQHGITHAVWDRAGTLARRVSRGTPAPSNDDTEPDQGTVREA